MIGNRRGLTIFNHAMLLIADRRHPVPAVCRVCCRERWIIKAVLGTPMTLIPRRTSAGKWRPSGPGRWREQRAILADDAQQLRIMAFGITVGKIIGLNALRVYAIVWFHFPFA